MDRVDERYGAAKVQPTVLAALERRVTISKIEPFTFAAGMKAVNFCCSEAAVGLLRLTARTCRWCKPTTAPMIGWCSAYR